MIEDFLQIAGELARRESGKPRQASLRRAVSTAYYAVFHALAKRCTEKFVGRNSWKIYTPVYRSLEHQKARKICDEILRDRQAAHAMVQIAHAFINLQNARNLADYDPEPRLKRAKVLDLIETAGQAVHSIQHLSEQVCLELAVRLFTKPR